MKVFQAEHLKKKESEFVHNPETDALAGRVREIARSALSMSDLDLEEFFNDEGSVDHVVSAVYLAKIDLCSDREMIISSVF